MAEIIIIIVLSLILIGLIGVVLYSLKIEKLELLSKIQELVAAQAEKEAIIEKKQAYDNFKPYLICTLKEEPIFNEKGEEVGILPLNTFHTIIFEEDGKGQLFSGEGWVDLSDVIKNPVRNMSVPMKVVDNTPLKNGPGLGYKTLGTVMRNENVEVIDLFGVWSKIRLSDGNKGYVYYKNLR